MATDKILVKELHVDTPEAADALPKKRQPRKAKATKKSKKTGRPKGAVVKAFPSESLASAIAVASSIKEYNAGNPWVPSEVAKALKVAAQGMKFWYLCAGSRDHGLTIGTRHTETIELTTLGRSLVYASSPAEEREAIWRAFNSVDLYKRVFDYYKGSQLPELKYLQNTLSSTFGIPVQHHEEFVKLYTENLAFCQKSGAVGSSNGSFISTATQDGGHAVVVGEPSTKTKLTAFVAMPFSEKTGDYPTKFFDEVLRNLITPAAVESGFKVETARKDGSDIIQSTIMNELIAADLVIVDLTEHNPNVLFELGVRLALDKPTALIRARGTAAIFDVDNLLRVFDYDPNLWKSTLEIDLPKLTAHIKGTWENRDSTKSYMKLLKQG